MKTIRIGAGAGYGGDRIEPAIDLLQNGNLDYMIFECLAERTIALANQEKNKDASLGYNHLLEYRFEEILKEYKKGNRIRIVTNMGAANPYSAAKKIVELAKQKNINIKVAVVLGDDVLEKIEQEAIIMETGEKLSSLSNIISANAYIGCSGIVESLQQNADIVITGRVADPSLVLGILVYEFGWSFTDYDVLARGTMAGHLLECAGQITGGYYYDGLKKKVPDLYNLGFPIACINRKGDIEITKTSTTGGIVNEMTCKEQALYEIQDPENYYTPDCIVNIKNIKIEEIEKNRVRISNISGKPSNGFYKVSVGYKDGYIGEGQISYGGYNALLRTKKAKEIIEKRFKQTKLNIEEIRFDYMGINSLYQEDITERESIHEVRLRVAARVKEQQTAIRIGQEVEALYTNGPSGGGGVTQSVREIISIASVLMKQDKIEQKIKFLESREDNEGI
ncbi:MAG: acyclic terpene utilization AtuA family protein [Coprobacillaceae bacterium]